MAQFILQILMLKQSIIILFFNMHVVLVLSYIGGRRLYRGFSMTKQTRVIRPTAA